MCSIRDRLPGVGFAWSLLALLAGGCALKQSSPPDPVSHAPLNIDEAMQQRQWTMSAARYQNGATVAGPTGFLLISRTDAPIWQAALTDTPVFVVNSLAAPFVLLCTPPFESVVYSRGAVEASYNLMPPLPAR